MSYWIYNMGLPVPVPTQRLIDKYNVKPLSALAANAAINERDHTDATIKPAISGYIQPQPPRQQVYYAEQIMSKKVQSLSSDMDFRQAWAQFKQHNYRHFPVVDQQQRIVGIVSDRNMLAHIANTRNSKALLSQVMQQPVLTADSQTLIRDICQVMFTQHIGALPITDGEHNLVGMITRSDILRSMVQHGPVEIWT